MDQKPKQDRVEAKGADREKCPHKHTTTNLGGQTVCSDCLRVIG